MFPESVQHYARERKITLEEAAQTFLQVVVLRHLSGPEIRFMGGSALVLGYGNPRFSEDVDLTQVPDPQVLRPSLMRARIEIEGWFGSPTILNPPKSGGRTWRLVVRLGRSESLKVHIDSQPYKAYTSRPLVIEFPPPFVCLALELDEIMAEKVIALAYRRYLGGRDLFDLWFHWLRSEEWSSRKDSIRDLVRKKLKERHLMRDELHQRLSSRLPSQPRGRLALTRAREEWIRYLPPDFHRPAVLSDMLERCLRLPEIFS